MSGKGDEISQEIRETDFSRDIKQESQRTVQRTIDSYEADRGLIPFLEVIPDAYEAYLDNIHKFGVLPDDHELVIRFHLFSESGVLEKWDNAGGVGGNMPTGEKLDNHYIGLDSPGQEKRDEDRGHGHGRGKNSVMGLGWDGFYVETWHDDTCVKTPGNLNRPQNEKLPDDAPYEIDPEESELDEPGTYLRVEGLEQQTIEQMQDIETIREELRLTFPVLLNRDDVRVEYYIDDQEEPHVFEGIDIDRLREEAELDADYPSELEVERYGEVKKVKNIELFDTRKLPEDEPPFEGTLIYNTDQNGNYENTVKKEYKPRRCSAMRDNKLIGLADFSEFGDDEDPTHEGYSSITPAETGLKDMLQAIGRRHFNVKLERDIAGETKQDMAARLADDPAFSPIVDAPEENEQTQSEQQSSTDTDQSDFAFHTTDVDPRSPTTIEVSLPDDFDGGTVTNVTVNHLRAPEQGHDFDSAAAHPDDAPSFTFTPEMEGKYMVSGTLEDADGDHVADATGFFVVGREVLDSSIDIDVFNTIREAPLDSHKKWQLYYDEETGEWDILINRSNALWEKATSNTTSKTRLENNRFILTYRWSIEALKHLLTSRLDPTEHIDESEIEIDPVNAINNRLDRIVHEFEADFDGPTDIITVDEA